MKILLNIVGIVLVFALSWLVSYNRKAIPWKRIAIMLGVEFIIAFIIVKVPLGQKIVTLLSDGITAVISCGNEGLEFVFGDLFTGGSTGMFVFIVQSLGNIIFVSALVSALYYLGVIGFVVKWIGKAVGLVTKTSEVETFVAVANMFLGHTDSPILVAKYLPRLTESEIFVILVSGMGSMSASILGGYSALGIPMSTLLIASALVPIGSIMVSKVMCPQTEEVEQVSEVKMDNKGNNTNVIDALSEGCNTGIQMVISIGASIVGFMGVMAIFDMILGVVGFTFADLFGYIFAPFGFLFGFEGADDKHTNICSPASALYCKFIQTTSNDIILSYYQIFLNG